MRIAIVGDSRELIDLLRTLVESRGDQVAWTAGDANQAVEKCLHDRPQLLILPVGSPGIDGVQLTSTVMRRAPCPILLLAPRGEEHAGRVFEAMGSGALDVTSSPVTRGGVVLGGPDLLRKIATVAKLIGADKPRQAKTERLSEPGLPDFPLIAIGCSTGGPKALATLLSKLPRRLGAGMVIAQHIDVQFSSGLAEWLEGQTGIRVQSSYEGIKPAQDQAVLASTNDHLVLGADMAFHHVEEPRNYPYRPSVDSLFLSLSRYWPRKDIAVLLTGMGRDGAKGLLALRLAGWRTIAQDEATSTVFGMPKAAIECGAAAEILPLDQIAGSVAGKLKKE